jgi:hypothetical protein
MNDDNGGKFTLGEHEGRLKSLERDMSEVKDDVKKILEAVSSVRGGWKTVTIFGAMAVGLVEGYHELSEWLHHILGVAK